ncbi:MAG: prolyl oligopeptidase family serine peptidase [Microscillaceae bacterium]|nr:prolyl oligopeptidase family serine peptidase [Microscillaceae bacterium]
MTNFFNIFLIISTLACLGGCTNSTQTSSLKKNSPTVESATTLETKAEPPLKITDSLTTLEIGGHWLDIHTPQGNSKGNIIVLPGWSFPRQDWCQKSALCRKARAAGYLLIMPEMGKSVYSSQFYPETLKDWQVYPNKAWLVNQMIPTLQKDYQMLLPNQKNYVLGLSTGGRGVAMLALALPDLFAACAALSGDFDQTQMPTDRLMIGYYGDYQRFKARWEGEDNPTRHAAHFKTPIYLGHGKQDKIVPVSQTEIFYKALKKANPKLIIRLNLVNAQHDYAYWDSEVDNMLHFFAEIK